MQTIAILAIFMVSISFAASIREKFENYQMLFEDYKQMDVKGLLNIGNLVDMNAQRIRFSSWFGIDFPYSLNEMVVALLKQAKGSSFEELKEQYDTLLGEMKLFHSDDCSELENVSTKDDIVGNLKKLKITSQTYKKSPFFKKTSAVNQNFKSFIKDTQTLRHADCFTRSQIEINFGIYDESQKSKFVDRMAKVFDIEFNKNVQNIHGISNDKKKQVKNTIIEETSEAWELFRTLLKEISTKQIKMSISEKNFIERKIDRFL